MTDNFNLIREYLIQNGIPQENSSGLLKHYVVEIISRGKDNPDMPAANRHFRNYYITCIDTLDKYEQEIKTVCDVLRMRAYISVNYKMYDQILKDCVAEAANRVATNNYGKPYAIYEHCSGKFVEHDDRKFVLDIDEGQNPVDDYIKILDEYLNIKPILEVPTRTGWHLITEVFNTEKFNKICMQKYGFEAIPDIKRNHLTLLYENL